MLVTLAAGVVAKLWSASLCACTCVCLSVCPRGYLWNHTRNLYKIFVHVDMAVARSSFGRVTKSQWEGAIFGVFFFIHNALYSIAFVIQNGWIDRDAVWDDEWAWPEKRCVMWGWWSPREIFTPVWKLSPPRVTIPESAVLGETCARQANEHNNCELDWSMQRHTTEADAWLQALDKYIVDREVGAGIAHSGRSLISTIALFLFVPDFIQMNAYFL